MRYFHRFHRNTKKYNKNVYTRSFDNNTWISSKLLHFGTDTKWFALDYFSKFSVNGCTYYWLLQWLAAEKARLFNDFYKLKRIMNCKNIRHCKQLFYTISAPEGTREYYDGIWKQLYPNFLVLGNILKFKSNKFILAQLLQTIDHIIVTNKSQIEFKHAETVVLPCATYIFQSNIYRINTTNNSNVLADCLMIARDKIYENIVFNHSQLNTLCPCRKPSVFDYIHFSHVINITSTIYNKKYLIKYKPACKVWQRLMLQNSNDAILTENNLPVLVNCAEIPSDTQRRILHTLDPNYS
jgi:predicted NAD-dependent protein-ADP-ribosyltransferase YbiA (DUF1768 family)